MNRNIHRVFCLLMLAVMPACADNYPPTYSAEAITATVIDAETKKPMEGVIVTANWQLLGGMEGNYPVGQQEVLETVTDANGRFHFPAWGPKKRPKGYLREDDPQLLLFKPGYEYKRLANAVSSKINHDPVRRSVWNGKVIELKRFKGTGEGYAEHLGFLNSSLESILSEKCMWKKIPRMILALDKQSKPLRVQGLHGLLSIDSLEARYRGSLSDCGSVNEYFRNYRP